MLYLHIQSFVHVFDIDWANGMGLQGQSYDGETENYGFYLVSVSLFLLLFCAYDQMRLFQFFQDDQSS